MSRPRRTTGKRMTVKEADLTRSNRKLRRRNADLIHRIAWLEEQVDLKQMGAQKNMNHRFKLFAASYDAPQTKGPVGDDIRCGGGMVFHLTVNDRTVFEKTIRDTFARFKPDAPEEAIQHWLDRQMSIQIWLSEDHQVAVYEDGPPCEGWPPMTHLSIKRRDKEPIRDWRELQAIKNALVGEQYEAVELYPADSRLVDTANQYHLWVLNQEGTSFPFGFTDRLVDFDGDVDGVKQRPDGE